MNKTILELEDNLDIQNCTIGRLIQHLQQRINQGYDQETKVVFQIEKRGDSVAKISHSVFCCVEGKAEKQPYVFETDDQDFLDAEGYEKMLCLSFV